MNRSSRWKLIAATAVLTLTIGAGSALAAQSSGTDGDQTPALANSQIAAQSGNTQTPDGEKAEKDGKHSGYKMKMAARPGSLYEQAAKTLGMDKKELMQELRAGKSLSDVAKSKHVKESDLKAALLKEQTDRIEKAQKNGKLSAEKAETIKGKMSGYIDQFMSRKGMMFEGRMDMMPAKEKLAKRLGITEDELLNKLKSGKSIAEIAKEKGVAKDELIRGIKEDMTPFIENMIEHKRSVEKESK